VIVHNVAQLSPEWRALRCGRLTASRAADILATTKGGTEAAARRDLRLQLVLERLTGEPEQNDFQNAAMARGVEKEPAARAAYEALTGYLVTPVGFVTHDTLMAGCSPDGMIGDWEGCVEIKCPKSATHLSYLEDKAEAIPPNYTAQLLHTLWITGAPWADLFSFDDRFPSSLQCCRRRLVRNDGLIAEYQRLVVTFLAEVEAKIVAMKEWQPATKELSHASV
jgi:putative phage-type endonuclease